MPISTADPVATDAPARVTSHESWWAGLRQRMAFRLALFYGSGTFLLLQAADSLVPALGLPDQITRVIALAFVGGLPVAVAAGWILDLRAVRGHESGRNTERLAARGLVEDRGGEAFMPLDEEGSYEPHGGRVGPILVLGTASTTISISVALAVLGWSRLGLETYLALWATVAGGVWFLFDKTEQSVGSGVRRQASEWLQTSTMRELLDEVPTLFQVMFDRVFGTRHVSWTCFYRSCFASLVAVTLVMAGWFSTRPEARILASEPAFIRSVLWLVFFTGLLNFIPDYLSLLETRVLLRHATGRWRTRTILVVDALFTACISFVVIRYSMELLYGSGIVMRGSTGGELVVGYLEVDLGSMWGQLRDMVLFSESYGNIFLLVRAEGARTLGEVPVPISVFFYSAFITSAWLWVFAGATVVLRMLTYMGERTRSVMRVLGADLAPFRAVGYASVVVVTVAFALGLPWVIG